MLHLFTRTTSTGKQIDGYATAKPGFGKMLVVTVDGAQHFAGAPGVLSKRQLAQVPAGYTHVAGSVPLLAAEFAAYQAARIEQLCDLHAERRALVAAHNAIAAELDAERARAWDVADDVAPLASPALDAARAALDAFDVAHPEVKAAIAAEQAAAVERNRWM